MASPSKAGAALAALREDLVGDVFAPGDPGYDEARTVFNAMIDRRPAVIAQCVDENDVVRAVRFARELDLKIAVRGGGHSVAGSALGDGAVVIDLRHMRAVTVDPEARTARIAGGATMSDLDRACEPHALATTGGRASTTGVGGFVLGGGTGWLDRCHGLAVDNLLGVDLVTADGRRVRADADDDTDLFWALHGGGGNFGVATSLTLRLYELPEFAIALLLYRPEFGREAARTYRDVIAAAPDEASGAVLYLTAPPEEFVPPHLVGSLVCGVLLTYAGSEADLRKVAEPLLALPHEGEVVGALPYADVQCMLDDPPGMRNYWSAEYLTGAPDDYVEVFCARGEDLPVPTGTLHALFPQGGAIAAGPHEFPVPYRDAPWGVHPFGLWEDPADDERCIRWVRDVRADARPWSTGAVYLNFIGDEGADRVVAGVGAENAGRLARVKRAYDPDNVFRFNHNIRPA
ncbi:MULTISPECIES: FAD-binding oxidoreductase [Streptomyces]|uniref:FAD-binding oxidoreductase n=1 Tax=Streptomyces antibioticus TaxID=1890 RepID=A0AAE6Y7I8_STRAT|nr:MULTISPECIES: FAD-binding oxidoreductase [Streptomyces]MBO7935439.1 FAD-binding oxidoreductase [Streptomyces sp. S9]NUV64389.1 FAD-binding oxidoreductase [Streptomyces sp. CAI-85]OOQ53917.1 FAD-binding protein [Streptomyces antibioticus]QIT43709.1 FAD-binding oxidoreductase [Streptomyces antibioticus]